MTQRSEHRAAESAHRVNASQRYFTFPRQSGTPQRRRNLWPLVGFTVLCWLAFGAVVGMIYAGVK